MNSLRLRAQRRGLAGRSSSLRKRVCARSLLRTFAQLRLASILPTRPTLEPRSLFPRKLLARAISRPRNELRAQFGGKNLAFGEHLVLFLSRALRRTEKALNPIFLWLRPSSRRGVECVSPASFPRCVDSRGHFRWEHDGWSLGVLNSAIFLRNLFVPPRLDGGMQILRCWNLPLRASIIVVGTVNFDSEMSSLSWLH